jgi:hypothetical protein
MKRKIRPMRALTKAINGGDGHSNLHHNHHSWSRYAHHNDILDLNGNHNCGLAYRCNCDIGIFLTHRRKGMNLPLKKQPIETTWILP